jgi:hypothetical protein
MEKNWLIRTKNNHILGPVSKNKVRELLAKGSIKADDELCSGNGYWFYVREKELVEKYITGERPQDFNPVAEAISVVVSKVVEQNQDEQEIQLPSDDDLAFPDELESVPEQKNETDESPVEDLDTKSQSTDIIQENSDTLDKLRDKANITQKKSKIKASSSAKEKNINEDNVLAPVTTRKQKGFLGQNMVQIIAFLFFILALLAFYYRKRIINQILSYDISIVSPVHAQVIPESLKKKFNI